ncbi:MAG: sigma-70 family RNA polymerase sigma factor [Polyangiales bacterium]
MLTLLATDAVAHSRPLEARAASEVRAVTELPAFEALYREHFDFVWRALVRLGVPRRDLEDQLQEVFKVVHVNRAAYDGRASVRAWLFGIANNVSRTYRRGIRRKGIFDPLPEVLADPKGASAERSASTRQDVAVLSQVLSEIGEDLRDVFIMTEFLEMTAREIGEALGLSPNTVSTRLRRAWDEVERKVALHRRRQP